MAARSHEDTVLRVEKNKIKPPRMFKVVLLNDDFTPMEFVVLVLQTHSEIRLYRSLLSIQPLIGLYWL